MALPFFIFSAIAALLLSPAVTARNAVFSTPFQILFGGQSLTHGTLTLNLAYDCSLFLRKNNTLVWSSGTTLATSHCALILQSTGQILLVPDDETVQPATLGNSGDSGLYALLLYNGKLGIYGPSIWSNGVGLELPATPRMHSSEVRRALKHPRARQGLATPLYPGQFVYSGEVIIGSKNGDTTLLTYEGFSAVLTSKCTLAVVLAGEYPWTAWESDVSRTIVGQCQLSLSSKGELLIGDHVTYANGTEVTYKVWSSNVVSTKGSYFLTLRFTGQLGIYGVSQWLYSGNPKASTPADVKMLAME